jgi:NAD(P)-dependent dehydrogenase (short-subunit alcohol dehydrogenase family)
MIEGGAGSIVIVSSVAGVLAGPEMAGYVTAKHALIGLTRSLAIDYGPKGVRVNALCPGWVRTPMSEREMDTLAEAHGLDREAAFALVTKDLPLRRVAEPDEIASVALFLASDEASFVTGAVVLADGGSTALDVGTLAFAG